ncbi:MAG: hypothetical protein AAGJ50_13960, partial [Pseudomonadota bacterium]
IRIHTDGDLASIPARLAAERRKALRLSEVSLRRASAAIIAGQAIPIANTSAARLLLISNGSPKFLALAAVLKNNRIDVTVALTAMTAHDYLHRAEFSGVLLDIEENEPLASAFIENIADSRFLSSVPIIVGVGKAGPVSDRQSVVLGHATEIIEIDEDMAAFARAIALIVERHRSESPLAPQTVEDVRIKDKTTGLFTKTFLETHLTAQVRQCETDFQPLTFLALQLQSRSAEGAHTHTALSWLAKYLNMELRQTDCAARLDWSTIGVSLIDTPYTGGVRLAHRLLKAFNDTQLGSSCTLSWRAVEKRRYHQATDLISAACSGPYVRDASAA